MSSATSTAPTQDTSSRSWNAWIGDHQGIIGFTLVWLVVLGAAIVALVVQAQPPPNQPPFTVLPAPGVFAVAAAVAVGIERVLELLWTLVDGLANEWWPLSWVSKQAEQKVAALNTNLKPVYEAASKELQSLQQKATNTTTLTDDVKRQLDDLQTSLDQLSAATQAGTLAGNLDSDRLQSLVDSASGALSTVRARYPSLQAQLGGAGSTLADLSNFVDQFKDNPGRQFLSLFAGSILGLLVAAFLHPDLFPVSSTDLVKEVLGVIVTGIIMGLGSNPTHEVVQAIQAYKQSTQAATTSSV